MMQVDVGSSLEEVLEDVSQSHELNRRRNEFVGCKGKGWKLQCSYEQGSTFTAN